jgi:hypothetical protein
MSSLKDNASSTFAKGEYVVLLENLPTLRLKRNQVLQVIGHAPDHWHVVVQTSSGSTHQLMPTRFRLASISESPVRTGKNKPMILSTNPTERKGIPLTTGVLDYFPLALAEVAKCSKAGNDQHNPGQPLHWAKDKSADHADCIPRHLIDRGTIDTDGIRHSAKLAWRALALLQIELENDNVDAI